MRQRRQGHGRHGFVISPRAAFPVLLVIVMVMFAIFALLDGNDVSAARVVGTAVVTAGILVLFGLLAILSRVRNEGNPEERGRRRFTAARPTVRA